MKCRYCNNNSTNIFVDLGHAPPSNAYLSAEELKHPEIYFPLKVFVCNYCWLVQTEDFTSVDNLFNNEYSYFSSTSASWCAHAKKYAEKMIDELKLTQKSYVIEIASNDGYLLKNFVASQIPCLGIEPTASTAIAAEAQGIPVIRKFFGEKLAIEIALKGRKADLIAGNNVYAHVPDINDFTKGLKAILAPNGTITLEFPHVLQLIENTQFDTIYHEHFSYLSLYTVEKIFSTCGLRIWNVEELTTHGGSLRVYGCHALDPRLTNLSVELLLKKEYDHGLQKIETYRNFQSKVNKIKDELLLFLIKAKSDGKNVGAYGAAAKGNTILNYAGIKNDLIQFICDASLFKQDKFMPGSHIQIKQPNYLRNQRLDYLIVLPWNISEEIIEVTQDFFGEEIMYVVAVPKLKIFKKLGNQSQSVTLID